MNTTKPFLPDYTGPDAGWALWVHHGMPLEYCTSFKERIEYIELNKPDSELPARRAALTWIPDGAIDPHVNQAKAAYDQAGDTYNQAWAAYAQARTAYNQAWTAYDQAGDTYNQAKAAYDQGLDAYRQAGDTYAQAKAAYVQTWAVCWPSLVAQYAPEVRHDCGELEFS